MSPRRKEKPFMRPVEAMFGRASIPASPKRSANSTAVSVSALARTSSIAAWRTWRAGASPVRNARSASVLEIRRRLARASPKVGVTRRPCAGSRAAVASMARRASHWPSQTWLSKPMRLATMWMWSYAVSSWRTATHGISTPKPMRAMKSPATASHRSAARRSPAGSAKLACQTGRATSGRKRRAAPNSHVSSRGSRPSMVPPTISAPFAAPNM